MCPKNIAKVNRGINEMPCLQSPTFTTEHVTINIYVTGRVPMRRLVYRKNIAKVNRGITSEQKKR
jgi:hypothetical protein